MRRWHIYSFDSRIRPICAIFTRIIIAAVSVFSASLHASDESKCPPAVLAIEERRSHFETERALVLDDKFFEDAASGFTNGQPTSITREKWIALYDGTIKKNNLKVSQSDPYSIKVFAPSPNGSMIEVGFFDYQVRSERELYADWLKVAEQPDYRKKGISTFLIAEVLRKNPKVERISGQLAQVNLQIYAKFRRSGHSPLEAFKETPIYKSCSALGFSRIDETTLVVQKYLSYDVVDFTISRDLLK